MSPQSSGNPETRKKRSIINYCNLTPFKNKITNLEPLKLLLLLFQCSLRTESLEVVLTLSEPSDNLVKLLFIFSPLGETTLKATADLVHGGGELVKVVPVNIKQNGYGKYQNG